MPHLLNTIPGQETLDRFNSILGAVKRRKRLRAKGVRLLAALRKKRGLASKVRRGLAKKPQLRSVWARLSAARRKALLAQFIKKNPKLKRKLALALLKKRLEERKAGLVTTPGAPEPTALPAQSPTIIMSNPSPNPVPEGDITPPAEAVEQEMDQAALDKGGEEEQANEEAAEQAEQETAEDATQKAEADAEEMSEETPEEAAEEAEQVTNDAAEATTETAGDLLLGWFGGKRRMRRRHQRQILDAIQKAKPLAGEVENLSGGEIQASHLLGAVGLIAKAKKGDPKAKKGIKALTKLAAKKGPKQKAAKKATAKLKIAHKIMKKTGTAKGTGKKKAQLAKKAPFARKVVVRNTGLSSYSAYQRGMATIPGFARAHYGS